ncbi:MAG TPA: dTMP kinase [Acidimicrobiales bacterium]|nr:dTMP kinase [Acidimicrobiales bacterium]
MARGRLIAFEGGEGCGKSTQAARFAARTGALLTREPGGTTLGEALRTLVLDHGEGPAFDARAETLVMLAARAQHVAEVVVPALGAGRLVVTDRFSHSTLAYQGYGRGLDVEELRGMCTWAAQGIWPDAVVLLEVSPEVAASRRSREADRLESAGRDFHDRVAAGFRELAAGDPERWLVADGSGTVEDVEVRVTAGLADMGIR